MRLNDLNPRWVGYGGEGVTDAQGNPVPRREGCGLKCDCPCGCGSPMAVLFANPLDGGAPVEQGRPQWQRTGDTFETLTLSPSIQRLGPCRWHGYIRNGEIVPA